MTYEPTGEEILAIPMPLDNDADADTIRDYLVELLSTVWREEEGFSGKRAFGNSGWQHEVYHGLAKAGLIEGEFDDEGYLDDCDYRAADALVQRAIAALRADNTIG
jgi:hypothetical protein